MQQMRACELYCPMEVSFCHLMAPEARNQGPGPQTMCQNVKKLIVDGSWKISQELKRVGLHLLQTIEYLKYFLETHRQIKIRTLPETFFTQCVQETY